MHEAVGVDIMFQSAERRNIAVERTQVGRRIGDVTVIGPCRIALLQDRRIIRRRRIAGYISDLT